MNKSVKRRTRSKKLRRSKKINKHSNKTKRKSISKSKSKRKRRKSRRRSRRKVKKGGFNHFYVPPFNLDGLKIGNETITSPLKLNETVAKFMDKKCI